MRLPRTNQQRQNDYIRRMTGGTLGGRVRSAAPIAATAKPSRRTVGVTSEAGCPQPPTGIVWDVDAGHVDVSDGQEINELIDQIGGIVLPHDTGWKAVWRTNVDGLPAIEFDSDGDATYSNGQPGINPDSSTPASEGTTVVVAKVINEGDWAGGSTIRHDTKRAFDCNISATGDRAWLRHSNTGPNANLLELICTLEGSDSQGNAIVIGRCSENDRALFPSHNCDDGSPCSATEEHGELDVPIGILHVNGSGSFLRRIVHYDRKLNDDEMLQVREWAQCEYGIDLSACT